MDLKTRRSKEVKLFKALADNQRNIARTLEQSDPRMSEQYMKGYLTLLNVIDLLTDDSYFNLICDIYTKQEEESDEEADTIL